MIQFWERGYVQQFWWLRGKYISRATRTINLRTPLGRLKTIQKVYIHLGGWPSPGLPKSLFSRVISPIWAKYTLTIFYTSNINICTLLNSLPFQIASPQPVNVVCCFHWCLFHCCYWAWKQTLLPLLSAPHRPPPPAAAQTARASERGRNSNQTSGADEQLLDREESTQDSRWQKREF